MAFLSRSRFTDAPREYGTRSAATAIPGGSMDGDFMEDGRREQRIPVLGSTLGPAFLCLSGEAASADGSETFATEATIRNLSINGVSASIEAASALTGCRVWIDVPLVGRKEAIVTWQKDGGVGCRFLKPLTADELSAGIASSGVLPGLLPEGSASRTKSARPHQPTQQQPRADLIAATVIDSERAVVRSKQRKASANLLLSIGLAIGIVICSLAISIVIRAILERG